MSQGHLGLFDTPPTQKEVRLSLALVGLLLSVALLILPVRDVRLPELHAFIPTVDAVMSRMRTRCLCRSVIGSSPSRLSPEARAPQPYVRGSKPTTR